MMSVRSLPRARRGFAVLLVGVLVGSLLTIAGGAGAANTAVEGSVDAKGARVLAGADRYATSVALATRFVESGGALLDEAIVVSGVSAVDAFAAVGLAAARDSVVLLTAQNTLPRVVREFIDEQQFAEVTIVGGTGAVSEAVEQRLSRIESVLEVNRIAGEDRFDTSAVMAAEVEEPGFWCDTDETVMFMIGGSSLADGVAVAPVATKVRTSVLLNPTDGLHPSVADVLEAQEVDRVVVVGGEAEISSTVIDELDALDIATTRVTGDTAAARSVELAKLVSAKDCVSVSVAANQFALVNGSAAAGAATLGGVLATSVAVDASLVPVLLVGDELPEEVAARLAAIPTRVGAALINVTLHAVGGTAAVSAAVMDAALASATTSKPLTATVTAKIGANSFTVKFSEPVEADTATAKSVYKVSGKRLLPEDRVTEANGVVTVRLAYGFKFAEGDTVSIAGGKITGVQVADGSVRNDHRTVAATTHTVVKPPEIRDRVRPTIRIDASENHRDFTIWVDEANLSDDAEDYLSRDEITVTVGGTVVKVADDGSNPHKIGLRRAFGGALEDKPTNYRWVVGCTSDSVCNHMLDGQSSVLSIQPGDKITIAAGAVVDAAGNGNRKTEVTVKATPSKGIALKGTPVVSKPVPARNLDTGGHWNAGTQLLATHVPTGLPGSIFTIRARTEGAYGGAYGNAWTVYVIKAADEAAGDAPETTDITVRFLERRKVIEVTFDDEATRADIVAALRAHEGFSEHFSVSESDFAIGEDSWYTETDLDLSNDDGSPISLGGGRTEATLTFTTTYPISRYNARSLIDAQEGVTPWGLDTVDGIHTSPSDNDGPFSVFSLTWRYTDPSLVPDGTQTINIPSGWLPGFASGTPRSEAEQNLKVRLAN